MSGGLTLELVQSWRPEQLDTAAADVGQAATRLEGEVSSISAEFRSAAASWQGPAADTAAERVTREATTGRALVDALEAARKALDNGATEIATAKNHLLSVVADARAQGFDVAGDGTVTAPSLPPVMSSPEGAASAVAQRNAEQQRLNEQATQLAERITGGLETVANADARTASALTSVEVPASIEAEVNAFIERLRTSRDLMSSLGAYGAGGAALAQSLIKGFSLFNKSKAYASWLSMTGRQLKDAGGALRFITGATKDAQAYQKFVRAMTGAGEARALFQTGKANGGVLRS